MSMQQHRVDGHHCAPTPIKAEPAADSATEDDSVQCTPDKAMQVREASAGAGAARVLFGEAHSSESPLYALQVQSCSSGSGSSSPANRHSSQAAPALEGAAGVAAAEAGGDAAPPLPKQGSGDSSGSFQSLPTAAAQAGAAAAAAADFESRSDEPSAAAMELDGGALVCDGAASEQQLPAPAPATAAPPTATAQTAAEAAVVTATAAAAQGEAAAGTAQPEQTPALQAQVEPAAPLPQWVAGPHAAAVAGAAAQGEVVPAAGVEDGLGVPPAVGIELDDVAPVPSGGDAAAPPPANAAAPPAVVAAADAQAAAAAAIISQPEVALAEALLDTAIDGLYTRLVYDALNALMRAMLLKLCPFLAEDGQQSVHNTAAAMRPALLPVMQQHGRLAVLAGAALLLRHLHPVFAADASMAWLAPCAEVLPCVHGAVDALGHLARLATDAVAHEYGMPAEPAEAAAQAACNAAAAAVARADMGAALQALLTAESTLTASAAEQALREVCAAVLLQVRPWLPLAALHAGVEVLLPHLRSAVAQHDSLAVLVASAGLLRLLHPAYAAHVDLNWLMPFASLVGCGPAGVPALRQLAVAVLVTIKQLSDGTWGQVVSSLLTVDKAGLAGWPPGGLQQVPAGWTWPAVLPFGNGQVVRVGIYPTPQAAHQARYSMAVALAADGVFDMNDLTGLQHDASGLMYDLNEDLTPSVRLLVDQHHLAML